MRAALLGLCSRGADGESGSWRLDQGVMDGLWWQGGSGGEAFAFVQRPLHGRGKGPGASGAR